MPYRILLSKDIPELLKKDRTPSQRVIWNDRVAGHQYYANESPTSAFQKVELSGKDYIRETAFEGSTGTPGA